MSTEIGQQKPEISERGQQVPTTPAMLLGCQAILAVNDVAASVTYYRDVLGFDDGWLWGDPPTHGGTGRDGVALQFSLDPERAATAEGRSLWINVANIDSLYARHQARGAAILSPLEAKPWGVREYIVRDLNGYYLRFAEGGVARESRSDKAADVQIESRLPTWPEMERLIRAVGWEKYTNFQTAPRVLETAVHGVVAIVEGETVGCALLMSDGAGFYYVRDVMVCPERQGQGIGTALMAALIEYFHTHAPDHALVGLFTGQNLHNFYAQFGFRGPANGLYGMTQSKHPKEPGG
jgi:GNAT superfamily N-acetyltransferase/uncharacterized glyoxalase superfamily protein PhnB